MAIENVGRIQETGNMAPTIVGTGSHIVHRAGFKFQAANALSILPTYGPDNSKLNKEIPMLSINLETLQTAQSTETEQQEAEAIAYSIPQQYFVILIAEGYALTKKPMNGT